MGEIKSTLDLVMEKTKNLSLSSEERQAQKNQEIDSRIRGLLQKFKDRALKVDNFKSEYHKLQKDYDFLENAHLIKEICGQIELGADNQALFELLAEFKVSDLERLTSVLQEYQTVLEEAAGQRRKILKDQLAKIHFVAGSAVVPNLENDNEWRKEAGEIRAKYGALLDEEKFKLQAG
jgi:RNA polymerase-interacting CarD/CdnL/TRCF family regulator